MRTPAISAVAVSALALNCAGAVRVPAEPPSRAELAELWVEPEAPRDLFWGVGGARYAPPADGVYTFKERDDTGFSVSYDVKSPDGMEWSAKIGPEAQTEVVVSRILWGVGYHQPPIYYLPKWTLERKGAERRTESEARFRPKLETLKRLDEYWSWADNPFGGTRQLQGLLVVLLMLNSTDLKDDNNSLYELKEPWDGARRWFVVRDVGAALGETGKLFPRRNWLHGFEAHGFIRRVEGDRVEFDYGGRHQELLETITPGDVHYGARLLQGLTDRQWRDAFRAGNYADADAERFIRRLRQKIADGLAVGADTARATNRDDR
jgi:hypothetical protein